MYMQDQSDTKYLDDKKLGRIFDKLAFLRCPNCRDNKRPLLLEEKALFCSQCQAQYPILRGIPVFSAKPHSHGASPNRVSRWTAKPEILRRICVGTPLWFLFVLYMCAVERKNFFRRADSSYAPEVTRWLPFGWASSIPYNLYLKAVETSLFSDLEIRSPSLEVGGGGGYFAPSLCWKKYRC